MMRYAGRLTLVLRQPAGRLLAAPPLHRSELEVRVLYVGGGWVLQVPVLVRLVALDCPSPLRSQS